MRSHRVYEEDLRGEFGRVLTELVLKGKHVPANHPFDWRVLGALEEIATTYPNATAEQLADARLFLERQMHRWPARHRRVAG